MQSASDIKLSVSHKKKKNPYNSSGIVDVLIYILMGVLALITLYPIIYIVSASFSNPISVSKGNVWLYPVGFSVKAYGRLFTSSTIWRSFLNSIFFTVVIAALNVGNSMLAGYALAKKGLVFRKAIVILILIPMYFTGGLIPTFIVITQWFGLYNNPLAVILPLIVGIWNIILARTFISRLPKKLQESALIDGAGELRIFAQIILPLSKPIMAVLALYTMLSVWNNWFSFMVYMPQRPEMHPLQMFLTKALIWGNMASTLQMGANVDPQLLRNKALDAAVNAQIKYAVMVVATTPIMAVYPFIQKYFVQGALLGSLKE